MAMRLDDFRQHAMRTIAAQRGRAYDADDTSLLHGITVKEAAAVVRRSPTYIYRLKSQGLLKATSEREWVKEFEFGELAYAMERVGRVVV